MMKKPKMKFDKNEVNRVAKAIMDELAEYSIRKLPDCEILFDENDESLAESFYGISAEKRLEDQDEDRRILTETRRLMISYDRLVELASQRDNRDDPLRKAVIAQLRGHFIIELTKQRHDLLGSRFSERRPATCNGLVTALFKLNIEAWLPGI